MKSRCCARRTQPSRAAHDNFGMTSTIRVAIHRRSRPGPDEVYAVLWIGALMIATRRLRDPLPAELDELAHVYFACFAPAAKA